MFSLEARCVCQVCDREITGTLYEQDGKILLKKHCDEHGDTTDLISGDAALFEEKCTLLQDDGPCTCSLKACLNGLCGHHVEHRTSIAFVDITTRCNMNCPVCYADAQTSGRDVPLEDLGKIVDHLVTKEDIHILIIIGGEPTIHKDLIPFLEKVKAAGLRREAFISTNGIKLEDLDFCKQLAQMGFRRFALGFDGTTENIYRKIRGTARGFRAIRTAMENLRKIPRSEVILNVTAIKGVNDQDFPNIVRYGLENSDLVRRFLVTLGTYCGRETEPNDIVNERVTLEDLERIMREATGVRVFAISASLIYSFSRPLEQLHLDFYSKRFPRHQNPLCDHMAYMAMTEDGKMVSLYDVFLRRPESIYRHGRYFNRLSARIQKSRERALKLMGDNTVSRALWNVAAGLYYAPQFFVRLASMFRLSALLHLAVSPFTLRPKRYLRKQFHLDRTCRMWLIPSGDKYNFIWDKTRYCPQHYYFVNSQTDEIVKVPGCAYLPFHKEYAERYLAAKSQSLAVPDHRI